MWTGRAAAPAEHEVRGARPREFNMVYFRHDSGSKKAKPPGQTSSLPGAMPNTRRASHHSFDPGLWDTCRCATDLPLCPRCMVRRRIDTWWSDVE
jgi:hypothetical protein